MEKPVEVIALKLKEIIDEKGPDYLAECPYEVYTELMESHSADRKTAGAVLCCLVSSMGDKSVQDYDLQGLSKEVQSACCFNKKMADRLSRIFILLYSEDNLGNWKQLEGKGLSDFLGQELKLNWKGFSVWDAGTGTVDCHYDAEIVLSPTEKAGEDKDLKKMLLKNPFSKKEDLQELFQARLIEYLDREFDSYCTSDDYYQPYVEDFFLGDCVSEWCKENGFEVISCEGEGGDDGFEPKLRRGWY